MKKRGSKYNYLNVAFLVKAGLLLALGVLVMSALDSRKAARIMGLTIEVQPLDHKALLIQNDEVKNIVYEGYRRDIEEMTIESVNIQEVETLLETEPFVLDADVYINAADELEIKIIQERPVARIMDVKGRAYYLSDAYRAFPISKHASARVVVFTGAIDDFNIQSDTLTTVQKGIVDIIDLLDEDKFARKMIEQIHINTMGQFLVIPKMGNFKFDLGNPVGLRNKLNKIELAYKEVIPKKGWNTYKIIDLSIENQIICRK